MNFPSEFDAEYYNAAAVYFVFVWVRARASVWPN